MSEDSNFTFGEPRSEVWKLPVFQDHKPGLQSHRIRPNPTDAARRNPKANCKKTLADCIFGREPSADYPQKFTGKRGRVKADAKALLHSERRRFKFLAGIIYEGPYVQSD